MFRHVTSDIWADLVAKRLRWVIDDDCPRQISTEYIQIFDVVSINTHAVLSEQSMPKQRWTKNSLGNSTLSHSIVWLKTGI